ncbi:DUF937 domain-containing protein [Starkeya sp. ORNL1]|uniref:YidB family protein n=1 Tax=Starkeya sp. ORNL1 TaxID=2709380 RepID=UPI001463B546|nr:YidB family protein [Starkeya sp. ORNL1]QJP15446.1 DUF937 domain-containing protein [Starkeya sp. ORNL1]
MGLFDDAVPGGNIAKPIMIALGALLVSKMLAGKSEPDQASLNPQPLPPAETPSATPDGGLLGGLGGLLDKLKNGGLADAADSWVSTGQNKPVQPGQLGSALGQQTISDLAKRAGMSEQELLQQLSQVLPGVVDKMTPNGQLPNLSQIASMFGQR